MTSIQGHIISHPCLAAQYIGLGALKECQSDMDHMVATYKHRCELITDRPGKAFGIDEYIRISYACHEDDFLEGLDRLEKFIKPLF